MKGFLLDTNCLSELSRSRPNPFVAAWSHSINENLLYVSVLTLGGIRKGTTLLPAGTKRAQLERWVEVELPAQYSERVLSINAEIAEIWGAMAGEARVKGIALAVVDGLIAATAKHHGLSLVTRNVRDFRMWDIPVVNPWQPV
jgi:predicted nucleic acid-binding protein